MKKLIVLAIAGLLAGTSLSALAQGPGGSGPGGSGPGGSGPGGTGGPSGGDAATPGGTGASPGGSPGGGDPNPRPSVVDPTKKAPGAEEDEMERKLKK